MPPYRSRRVQPPGSRVAIPGTWTRDWGIAQDGRPGKNRREGTGGRNRTMHKRDLLLAAFLLLALTSAHAGAAREARSAGPLRLLSYGGVFQQGYTEAVLKPFAASRRTEIEFIGTDTSAAMLERLRAERNDPKADVVIMDASTALTACAEGLVEPINP